MKILQPPTWREPSGYSNGVAARGTTIFVAGQVGWDEREEFRTHDFVGQSAQALANVVAVLEQAGATARHITRMTWFVTSKEAYLSSRRELGRAYRAVMGDHFPAMSLVVVAGLVEDGALVEIEATAVLPDPSSMTQSGETP